MMSSAAKILSGVCVVMLIALLLLWQLYSGLQGNYRQLAAQFEEQRALSHDQRERVQQLHALDTRHTQELTDAKMQIDKLRSAAERNPERVYIRAHCPETGRDTATGLADAAPARPDDTAVRNYWLLRERIAESEQMILGLQEYINTQCK